MIWVCFQYSYCDADIQNPIGFCQTVDAQVAQLDVRAAGREVTVRVAHGSASVAAPAGLVETSADRGCLSA